MQRPPKNPFKNLKLNPEEKELEEAFAKGLIKPIKVTAQQMKRWQNSARLTLAKIAKDKNINIRISRTDLDKIKIKAAEEGLPYQTLIGSILHKYNNGLLKSV